MAFIDHLANIFYDYNINVNQTCITFIFNWKPSIKRLIIIIIFITDTKNPARLINL